jgi:hypothetical protein
MLDNQDKEFIRNLIATEIAKALSKQKISTPKPKQPKGRSVYGNGCVGGSGGGLSCS